MQTESPHRVLGIICGSPGWGGLEINTLRLAEWLRTEGWKVHLLTAGGAPMQQHAVGKVSSVQAMREQGLPRRGAQLRILHAWLRRYKIRVLWVPFRNDLKVASLYKRFYDSRLSLVYQQHMQLGRSKRNLIHTLRYQMIDRWIAPLEYLRQETLRLSRVRDEKISVIPFGVDLSPFSNPIPSRAEARSFLGLHTEAFVVGVLGRLDVKKGQMLLLQALQQANQQGSSFDLLIMGNATLDAEGEAYARQLRTFVAEAGLTDRVHFRNYDPEVMYFFRAIDVFAMPSIGETFGMVTIEAMAAGVPVIGADADGTHEILDGGRLGWLFENGNAGDFLEKLSDLRQSAALAGKISKAKEEVLQRYSKEQMLVKIEALLIALLEQQAHSDD